MLVLAYAPLADIDEVAGTAQHARCSPAHLHMGFAADRRELEHRIKRRDFETTNIGHVEKIADCADRGLRKPAAGLLLSAPHKRNNGGGLFARRIFGHRRARPGKIFRRESEVRRLIGMQSANGHQRLLETSVAWRRIKKRPRQRPTPTPTLRAAFNPPTSTRSSTWNMTAGQGFSDPTKVGSRRRDRPQRTHRPAS
jgi:hypothetical protein